MRLALVLLAVLLVPVELAQADLKCVTRTDGPTFRTLRLPGAAVEIRYRPQYRAAAQADVALASATWKEYRRAFGRDTRARYDDPTAPYQVYYTHASDLGPNNGIVVPYCRRPDSDAAVVNAQDSRSGRRATLVHELLHSFQIAVRDTTRVGTWWNESAAAWAEHTLQGGPPYVIRGRDELFIQFPGVRLDLFEPHNTGKILHHYGAWRFIQFLQSHRGWTDRQTLSFIARIVSDRVVGEIDIVRARLPDLGDVLARFWASRLKPEGPGPKARGRAVEVDEGTRTVTLSAGGVSADVVRLGLATGIRQVAIDVGTVPPGTQLWLLDGPRAERVDGDDVREFCVGAPPASEDRPWPGQLPLAFTNGASEPAAQSVHLTVHGGADACPRPPDIRGPGCVPTPAYNAPAGFTARWTYFQRAGDVGGRLGIWFHRYLREVDRALADGRSQADVVARGAAAMSCAASLLAAVPRVPPDRRARHDAGILALHNLSAAFYERVELAGADDRCHEVFRAERSYPAGCDAVIGPRGAHRRGLLALQAQGVAAIRLLDILVNVWPAIRPEERRCGVLFRRHIARFGPNARHRCYLTGLPGFPGRAALPY